MTTAKHLASQVDKLLKSKFGSFATSAVASTMLGEDAVIVDFFQAPREAKELEKLNSKLMLRLRVHGKGWKKGEPAPKVLHIETVRHTPVSRGGVKMRKSKTTPEKLVGKMEHWFSKNEYRLKGGEKPTEANPSQRADLCLAKVKEGGKTFETGKPVEFTFQRNTKRAPQALAGDPYQQKIEPAGVYLLHRTTKGRLAPGHVQGDVQFDNPLVLFDTESKDDALYGPRGWKARLSNAFEKKGNALTRALVKAGYDGVVTVSRLRGKLYTSEIVALDPKALKKSTAPNPLGTLPTAGKQTWERVYAENLMRNQDEGTAARIAWSVVKKDYQKVGSRWVKKPRANPEGNTMKHGIHLEAVRSNLGSYQLKIDGRVGKTKITGYTDPVWVNKDTLSRKLAEVVTTVTTSDGQNLSFRDRRKVVDAVLAKFEGLQALEIMTSLPNPANTGGMAAKDWQALLAVAYATTGAYKSLNYYPESTKERYALERLARKGLLSMHAGKRGDGFRLTRRGYDKVMPTVDALSEGRMRRMKERLQRLRKVKRLTKLGREGKSKTKSRGPSARELFRAASGNPSLGWKDKEVILDFFEHKLSKSSFLSTDGHNLYLANGQKVATWKGKKVDVNAKGSKAGLVEKALCRMAPPSMLTGCKRSAMPNPSGKTWVKSKEGGKDVWIYGGEVATKRFPFAEVLIRKDKDGHRVFVRDALYAEKSMLTPIQKVDSLGSGKKRAEKWVAANNKIGKRTKSRSWSILPSRNPGKFKSGSYTVDAFDGDPKGRDIPERLTSSRHASTYGSKRDAMYAASRFAMSHYPHRVGGKYPGYITVRNHHDEIVALWKGARDGWVSVKGFVDRAEPPALKKARRNPFSLKTVEGIQKWAKKDKRGTQGYLHNFGREAESCLYIEQYSDFNRVKARLHELQVERGRNPREVQELENLLKRFDKESRPISQKRKSQANPMHPSHRKRSMAKLEGPFTFPNGRTVYYDPGVGEYYDRSTDLYLSRDEAWDLHTKPGSKMHPNPAKKAKTKKPSLNKADLEGLFLMTEGAEDAKMVEWTAKQHKGSVALSKIRPLVDKMANWHEAEYGTTKYTPAVRKAVTKMLALHWGIPAGPVKKAKTNATKKKKGAAKRKKGSAKRKKGVAKRKKPSKR